MMDFRFIEFNDRRSARGADAARVAVIEDGEEDYLWMSQRDIAKNMMAFGRHPELVKAYEAYGDKARHNRSKCPHGWIDATHGSQCPECDRAKWIVELEEGVWLAPWSGDPGRTLLQSSAKKFSTQSTALRAIEVVRKKYAGKGGYAGAKVLPETDIEHQ